jgi:hypothetical protein
MKLLTASEQIERMRNRRRMKKVSRGLRATLKKISKMKRPPAELKTKADVFSKILIELRKLVASDKVD